MAPIKKSESLLKAKRPDIKDGKSITSLVTFNGNEYELVSSLSSARSQRNSPALPKRKRSKSIATRNSRVDYPFHYPQFPFSQPTIKDKIFDKIWEDIHRFNTNEIEPPHLDYTKIRSNVKYKTVDDMSLRPLGGKLPFTLFGKYSFREKPFEAGGYGEVWRAKRIKAYKNNKKIYDNEDYVLKKIDYSKDFESFLSAKREIYFGEKLSNEHHVAPFVESFEDERQKVIWLVFKYSGTSIKTKLYSFDKSLGRVFPSKDWVLTKKENRLLPLLREVGFQLLEAVSMLHSRGVLHRDIKPGNILVDDNGFLSLIDFGSAVDLTGQTLYGPEGPTKRGITMEYAPPEVVLGGIPFDLHCPTSYDMWSVGVVFLELILASPDVFTISSRARAIIENNLRDQSEEVKRRAFKFAAFVEFGIFIPPTSSNVALTFSMEKFEEMFKCKLKECDPVGIGFEDFLGVKFLLKILRWDKTLRLKADEALIHSFFAGEFLCKQCGKSFEFLQEKSIHEDRKHHVV